MNKCSILMTTYHEAFLVRGGGEYELLSIAEALRQIGFIVDIYGPYSRPIENYNVIIHFSVEEGGLNLLKNIKEKGKPIILWPNFFGIIPPILNSSENILKFVELVDYIAFKSNAERKNFLAFVDVPNDKQILCRSLADNSFLKKTNNNLFAKLYNLNEYALWIGIIEERKNQLSAIAPLRELDIPLVFVGKYRDKNYYDSCRRLGGDHVIFIDSLPQRSEIVRSAMQNSKFYIELSLEPPGLSAIEAGLSGCRMVLSDIEWCHEHFMDHAEYVTLFSSNSLLDAVERVLKRPTDNILLQNHLKSYCFPTAIEPLINAIELSLQ